MKIKILALLLMLSTGIDAQILRGSVRDEKGQPVIGAHVYWMDKSAETTTDDNGAFELPPGRKAGIKVKTVPELVEKLTSEAKAL